MAEIEVTKTELVWPGKYDEEGRLRQPPRASLPFQVVETINEGRASREAYSKPKQVSLFDVWKGDEGETFEEGWKNKLIWGDNLLAMASLLEKFAGTVDLIYVDPPFATGADFSFRADVGDVEVAKAASLLEEKAYRDTWGRGIESFIQMLYDRFQPMHELLAPEGTIYVHMGWDVSHYVKAVLDEIFGRTNCINQIIWKRQTAHSDIGQGSRHLGPIHDVIFLYSKSEQFPWTMQYTPYAGDFTDSFYRHIEPDTGQRFGLSDITGPGGAAKGNPYYEFLGVARYWRFSKERMEQLYNQGRIVQTNPGTVPRQKRYLDEMPGIPLQDLWLDIPPVQAQSSERLGYDTQKPEALLRRIVELTSGRGDLVADFFCGSGTTMAVAEKTGRRWIGCDLGRFSVHTCRKRLLSIAGCKPFEVLNLGRYERQYWQAVAFGRGRKPQDRTVLEYITFILRLYGAEPYGGSQYIHGKLGGSLVHVGSVDSPVTIEEITACIAESGALNATELHVLGWEWEMGLNDLMEAESGDRGIKLRCRQIPREVMEEQAIDRGDVRFFELAFMEATLLTEVGAGVRVELRDFAIRDTELIPPEIREKITKWSEYIDYWAVDWDFQNDTFMNGWQTYRTRQDRRGCAADSCRGASRSGAGPVLLPGMHIGRSAADDGLGALSLR